MVSTAAGHALSSIGVIIIIIFLFGGVWYWWRHAFVRIVHVKGSREDILIFQVWSFVGILILALAHADKARLFLTRLAPGERVEVGFLGGPAVANMARH